MARTIPAEPVGNHNAALARKDEKNQARGRGPMLAPERTLRCAAMAAGFRSLSDLCKHCKVSRQTVRHALHGRVHLSHQGRCAIAMSCNTPLANIDGIFDSVPFVGDAGDDTSDPSESGEPKS